MMKIGVIGTGYWGPNIVKNFLALKQEVVIHDIKKENARNTLLRFKECKLVDSLEDILQNQDIKAVAIAVPLRSHFELVLKSLQAGKHVFVEKPLCYSTDEANEIQGNVNGKVIMVGHITLFSSGIKKIKEIIANDRIGKLTGISFSRTHLGPIYQMVDVASEVACHDIATLLYLLPDLPTSVNAWGTSRLETGYQDQVNIILGYNNSLKSNINVEWTSIIRERSAILEGTKGTIVYRTNSGKEELTVFNLQKSFEAIKNLAKPQEIMGLINSEEIILNDVEPLYTELESFISCIESCQIPLTNIDLGRKVVTIIEAIRKSMNQGGITVKISW